ncbi:hypothetical protein ANCCAN_21747 [Ancylostoma caninum]|uniref:SH2 domain-containing protein n=1 Tax=Ancylostoma caninum TaxID=29170 RepID=A0A368FNM4_ANCCA|nr:hypothetical protein ANCCAN_21747 [Ancylostoma caninum]
MLCEEGSFLVRDSHSDNHLFTVSYRHEAENAISSFIDEALKLKRLEFTYDTRCHEFSYFHDYSTCVA